MAEKHNAPPTPYDEFFHGLGRYRSLSDWRRVITRREERGCEEGRRSNLAWPYACRFSSFSRLIWPSTGPLLHGCDKAARTAARSPTVPATKPRNAVCRAAVSQASDAATFRSRRIRPNSLMAAAAARISGARATRFEALEPIRQGVRRHFGAFAKDAARGLSVRHDHGSQYMSDAFQKELAFLGIESSPAFVWAPEGNGCAERFIRTLKENPLWVRTFDTVERLRHALIEFRDVYNSTRLIERHGFRSPAAIRAEQLPPAAKAA
jgi:hypothetical protein